MAHLKPSISLSYYTAPELSPLKMIEFAHLLNCQHIGLRLLSNQPGTNEMPLLYDKEFRKNIKYALSDFGITPLDANTLRIIPKTNVYEFLPFFDAAYELGAKHVLTTIDDQDQNRLSDNLNMFSELAIERNLTIDIEFVPWLSIANIEDASNAIKNSRCNNIGIAIDALHFHRSNSSINYLENLNPSLFRYFQICDAPILRTPPSNQELIYEATKNRLLPGDGEIDLVNIINKLPNNIPFAIEIPQKIEDNIDTFNHLKKIINSVKKFINTFD